VKDRHNGNLLLDKDGHIVHIDFGFIFTSSPAGNMNFESCPFKLTEEHIAVLNGMESKYFKHFRKCLIDGYKALHQKADEFICLVEMMTLS